MRKMTVLFLLVFGVVSASFAQNKDEALVRSLLAEQTKEWNNGNIPAFMETYWKSDSLIFIGKNGVTYGWQKTMDNYKKKLPGYNFNGETTF